MTNLSLVVFLASVGSLVYVVAGYPLLLHLLTRFRDRPISKDEVLRTVSIVLAVRNGEQFLADKLNSILGLNYPRQLIEILVVSDGSDDRTDDIAREFFDQGVKLWRLPKGGKAAALNLGISKAVNEILVLTDVRQKLDRESLRHLVACFGDAQVGAVSAELSILRGETEEESDTRLYWNYEVWIRSRMSCLDSTFGANGPLYAMRRSLAVPIPQDTLLDDVFLPMAAFFKGYRVILEHSARAFDYPTNLQSEFKRKVRTQAGLWQLLRLYPQLLTSSNRMRFHFLSAKYGRLAMPWLLILALASTPCLPAPFNLLALLGQVLFYGTALADFLLPAAFPLKRLSSPIRTFVVLVFAALLGIRVFFVAPRDLWKETRVRKVSS